MIGRSVSKCFEVFIHTYFIPFQLRFHAAVVHPKIVPIFLNRVLQHLHRPVLMRFASAVPIFVASDLT